MVGREVPDPDMKARIVHGVMLGATIAVPTVLATVRIMAGSTGTEHPARILAVIAPAAAGLAVVVSLILRGRLRSQPASAGRDAWWTANLGTAVALWSLAEGTGLLAGVAYFLTGNLPATLLAFAIAILLLLMHAPSRLGE
ncbi:MAG TPA: hypothetical protein VK845_03090 [Gemmatimonadales bacterium]|nr:hypothetical protein [Gemmatimonadales bacterium]